MSIKEKILALEEDITFVKEGAEYSEPMIMREAYPSNPDLGEFSSVYTFIEVTLKLIKDLEEIIEDAKGED